MNIVALLFVLVAFGSVMWVINSVVPIDARFKAIINVVVVLAVIGWLLNALGLMAFGPGHFTLCPR